MAPAVLGILVLFVAVVMPIAAGIALLLTSRRGGLGYPACGECKYNLSATVGTSDRCPECGKPFLEVGILPPIGPKRSGRFWGGLALLILPMMCFGLVITYSSMQIARARAAAFQAQQQVRLAQQQATAANAANDGSTADPDATADDTSE